MTLSEALAENARLRESVEHRRATAANIATMLGVLIDGCAPMLRLLPADISRIIDVCHKVAALDAKPTEARHD